VAIDLIDVNMYQVVASVTPESQNSGSIEWALPTTLVCGRTYQFYSGHAARVDLRAAFQGRVPTPIPLAGG